MRMIKSALGYVRSRDLIWKAGWALLGAGVCGGWAMAFPLLGFVARGDDWACLALQGSVGACVLGFVIVGYHDLFLREE